MNSVFIQDVPPVGGKSLQRYEISARLSLALRQTVSKSSATINGLICNKYYDSKPIQVDIK